MHKHSQSISYMHEYMLKCWKGQYTTRNMTVFVGFVCSDFQKQTSDIYLPQYIASAQALNPWTPEPGSRNMSIKNKIFSQISSTCSPPKQTKEMQCTRFTVCWTIRPPNNTSLKGWFCARITSWDTTSTGLCRKQKLWTHIYYLVPDLDTCLIAEAQNWTDLKY